MSFNNHLGFNVSKAIPTTSTTNTNTTSISSLSPSKEPLGSTEQDTKGATKTDTKSETNNAALPFLKSSIPASSPRMAAAATTTSLSEVSPATVETAHISGRKNDETDLIGLFDKFDVEQKRSRLEDDDHEEVDSLEEKMEQFNNANVDGKQDKTENTDTPESPQQETEEKPQEQTSISHNDSHSIPSTEREQQPEPKPPAPNVMGMQPYIIPEDQPSEYTQQEKSSTNPEDPRDDLLDVQNNQVIEEYQLRENDIPEDSVTSSAETQEYLPKEDTESAKKENNISDLDKQEVTRPRLKRNNSLIRTRENINPQEQYQSSHRPFDFQTFLNHLRKKSADPIVRYIRSFLMAFVRQSRTMNMTQLIRAINNFKKFIESKFSLYEPFASMDAADLENSNEGVEKLIMNRLYEYCFSPDIVKKYGANVSESILQDIYDDNEFFTQLHKFSWISGKHLDIDVDEIAQRKKENSKEHTDYMGRATAELNKMNNYRAPRDKIICILNSCKIIFSLLRVSKKETNADAFIPLLILVIMRAKTENLISNLRYIERFRSEGWLNHGETSYYLSSLQGAISFIENITKDDLTVTDAEFDANMEAWEASIRQKPLPLTDPKAISARSEAISSDRPNLSASNVLMASAELFSKSFSNFISSPPPEETGRSQTQNDNQEEETRSEPSTEQVDKTFSQLSEVFPNLDKAIMRDVIIMNKADVETSLDACLQLVSES